MSNKSIKKLVIKAINDGLGDVQKEFDEECLVLEQKLEEDKSKLATEKVKEVLGKLL